MTLPDERYRSINYTREFLRSLLDPKQTPKVPREVRKRAGMCLRHYPGEFDLFMIADDSPKFLKADAKWDEL